MKILIFSDRDGTINRDEDYFLGSSNDWKDKVEFLDGVIEGIKLINKIPNSKFYIVTNQAGVALTDKENEKEFDKLNEGRMDEVNKYIIKKLSNLGAIVDGYYACPYVDNDYVKKSTLRGRSVNPKYIIDNHPHMKPNPGMIIKAINNLGLKHTVASAYYTGFMIGDRTTDVDCGLNAGITSILIANNKNKEELTKKYSDKIETEKVYIAKDFLEAAKYIRLKVAKIDNIR